MKLLRSIQELPSTPGAGSALCIGVFDGVHRGHQMLLAATVEHARRLNLPALVLTFDSHPLNLLAPPYAPPLLNTPEEKADLLRHHGVDLCLMLPFDAAFAAVEPGDFLREIVAGVCRARQLVCGRDFRFGRGGAGDVTLMTELGPELDLRIDVRDDLFVDNLPVRSSRIRSRLLDGDVEAAARLLGRHYTLSGRVVKGARRGRSIGFPTANIEPPPGRLVPRNGVYAVEVDLPEGARAGGMLNIGVRPTFGADARAVEVHIFDFDGDLYDRDLSVGFVNKIRDEQRFGSVEALIAQLRSDQDVCRALLGRK